jgi:hypothetical protein
MKTLPIIDWLSSFNSERCGQVLNDQAMLGYMEYHHPTLLTKEKRQEKHFKSQQVRNVVYEQEALKLKEVLDRHDLKVLFLKGIVLIHDLYPEVGTRFMSDIDCYISRIDFNELDKILIPLGYIPHDSKKWLGNAHKREYTFNSELGAICIEFHNKLFWHRDDPAINTRTTNLPTLGLEETLVYLCGHYAFLHTCQKLYWLWDVYLFLNKYQDQLDQKRVDDLLAYFGFERSFCFVLKLLNKGFSFESSFTGYSSFFLVTRHAFFNDRQDRFGYHFLKFFIKDKLSDTLAYTKAFFLR